MAQSDEEALYWEARARELHRRLELVRARLVKLAAALPSEALELLEMDEETLEAAIWAESASTGIEATHSFVPSDVVTEIELVWQRLRQQGGRDG